jgi:hypothetical protein
MRRFAIHTDAAKHRTVLLSILMKMGAKWHNDADYTVSYVDEKYSWDNYPVVMLDEDMEISGNPSDYRHVTHLFPQDSYIILADLSDQSAPIVIEGVGDYSARVYKDHLMVGCQTISWEKFDEIAAARAKKENQ